MSGRLRVGVIGQTMRGAYCRSYFADTNDSRAVVFTDDTGAFADWVPAPGIEVVRILDGSVPRHEKLRRRLRRRAIEWLRSGSMVGTRAEAAIRRLRPPPRIEPTTGVAADAPLRPGLISQLDALHEASAIDEIVVFDLFDLPSVLEFSARARVPVMVR